MSRTASSLVLPILFSLWRAVSAQTEPCPADGVCDLRSVKPVCGIDGITYQTSCLAACQGVAVVLSEPCKPLDAGQFLSISAGVRADGVLGTTRGSIDIFNMNRFKEEGFQFVGLGKSDPKFEPKVMKVIDMPSKPPGRPSSAAVRFVASTGYLYRTNDVGPTLPSSFAVGGSSELTLPRTTSFDPTLGMFNGPRGNGSAVVQPWANDTAVSDHGGSVNGSDTSLGRKLLDVLGPDGRVRQTPTTSYPWRVVGLLLMSRGGCSGALISPTTVLTAAHCVHGGAGGEWATSVTYSAAVDGGVRPYGSVKWLTATIYTEWTRTGCNGRDDGCFLDEFFYDTAVVTLEEPLGARLGHLGLVASDMFSIDATSAGYPGDKIFGEMWRQNCPVSDNNPNDFLTSTDVCDVYSGQSGSPVWETSANNVRAIAVAGGPITNYFTTITTSRFWDVIRWSGDSFTAWNSNGENDRFRQIYLDRHDVSCANYPLRGLAGFRLEVSSNTAQMRFRYQCSPLRAAGVDGSRSVRRKTPANHWGKGNTGYLDRHGVSCSVNSVLTRWRLFRPSGTEIAVEYWCAPVSLESNTCENLATAWNSNGGGQVIYLDRHPVMCQNEKLLTRWRLETDNAAGQYRIAFTCCSN